MLEHLGTALTAAQNAGISQVADDAPDRGVVPILTRPGPVAQPVQVGGDPMCAEALVDVLLEDDTHDSGLGLIHHQFVQLVLPLVHPSILHKIIAIGSHTALKTAVLDQLA